MIRIITRDQILSKINRYLDSSFGTPAPDHLVLLEVGELGDYQRAHIRHALHMTLNQVQNQARRRLPDLGAEIVVYGELAASPTAQEAVLHLVRQGFGNVYWYVEGKADWAEHGLWMSSMPEDLDGAIAAAS